MNREAAAMGVPVYSIFCGKIGAVDRYLVEQGRLIMVQTAQDVRSKIKVEARRESARDLNGTRVPALETIVDNVETILRDELRGGPP